MAIEQQVLVRPQSVYTKSSADSLCQEMLRELVLQAGYSKQRISQATNTSPSTIGRLLAGNCKAAPGLFARILKLYCAEQCKVQANNEEWV